ncbi:MAG: hypothetical protein IJM81_08320 [Prevotella sp.]|nr:hypothetical protein [Prevotella sp.]
MKKWFFIFLLVALVALQVLQGERYWSLFAHFTDDTWRQFIRNFRMSGFDPITYSILSDWHVGYDLLRHPLLPFLCYPLYLLNQLLWWFTGVNCAQIIVGVLLVASACGAMLLHYRCQCEVVGVGTGIALLLTAMLMGFGMVMVTSVVPDHFCFSLFLLMLVLYRAGVKVKRGETFSSRETALLTLITAGVTLSNGIVVLMAVVLTNLKVNSPLPTSPRRGGENSLTPLSSLLSPLLVMLLLVGFAEAVVLLHTHTADAVADSMSSQFSYTVGKASRLDILIENFFGESLQLHRKYILGDVLLRRPVIIRYTWWAQYVVEAALVGMSAIGFWAGRRRRFAWLLGGVLVFNLQLHIVLGFGINEVHIMAAHWAFVIPLSIGYLFTRRTSRPSFLSRRNRGRHLTSIASPLFSHLSPLILFAITAYLWTYHVYQLVAYWSWPLVK